LKTVIMYLISALKTIVSLNPEVYLSDRLSSRFGSHSKTLFSLHYKGQPVSADYGSNCCFV